MQLLDLMYLLLPLLLYYCISLVDCIHHRRVCPSLRACESFFTPYERKFAAFAQQPGRAVSAKEQLVLLTDLCVSYHAYYGCLYTWTREPECWSREPNMVLMNATFTVLCHPSVFPRVNRAKDCVEAAIQGCRRPNLGFHVCESMLSMRDHVDCIYKNVRSFPFNTPFNADCSLTQKEVFMLLEEVQLGLYGQALDLHCTDFPEPTLDNMFEVFEPSAQPDTFFNTIGPARVTVPLPNSGVSQGVTGPIVLSPLYPVCGSTSRLDGTKCLLEFSTKKALVTSTSKFTASDVNLSRLLLSADGEDTIKDACLKLDSYQSCLEQIWVREGRCSFGISLVATPRFVLAPICADISNFMIIRRHIGCLRGWHTIEAVNKCFKPLMALESRSQRLFVEQGSANDLCAIAYAVRSAFHCLAEQSCPISSVLETDSVIRAAAAIQIRATETAMEEGCPIEINDSTLFV